MKITISMPERTVKKLREIKERTGIPISQYITRLVESAVKGDE